MIHIEISGFGLPFLLTKDNEKEIKETLSYLSKDTLVVIQETGEVLEIGDIFDYDINHISS